MCEAIGLINDCLTIFLFTAVAVSGNMKSSGDVRLSSDNW